MTDNIKRELVDEAMRLVSTDRRAAYGDPRKAFQQIAGLWNVHVFGDDRMGPLAISAADVALMMMLTKIARLAKTPDHRDSVLDIIGYALCYAEINLAASDTPTDRALDDVARAMHADTADGGPTSWKAWKPQPR